MPNTTPHDKDRRGEANPIRTEGSNQYTDPTYNVLQLVNAAVQRLNDISELTEKKNEKIDTLNDKIMDLHVMYGEKLSIAESKRIDAIRAVDVGAVAIASERAVAQATVLANQVSQSAETLRTLVATTASSAAQQFQQVTSQLMDRISQLEKSQYEKTGLSGVAPEVLSRLGALETNKNQGAGKTLGMNAIIGWIVAAVAVIGFLIKLMEK